jgi:hypothetical protein
MYHDLNYEEIILEARNIIQERRVGSIRESIFSAFEEKIFKPKGIKAHESEQIIKIICALDETIKTVVTLNKYGI